MTMCLKPPVVIVADSIFTFQILKLVECESFEGEPALKICTERTYG